MMCSNDEENDHIIGNANTETIYNIWHGEALQKVRELHNKQDGFKSLDVCKRCYLPRATESNETSKVNGREFDILNYVNRTQTIGE